MNIVDLWSEHCIYCFDYLISNTKFDTNYVNHEHKLVMCYFYYYCIFNNIIN